ncbi:MAG: glycosyltransferase family 39 protein [Anaerolineae bacterium]|nr:glycosyltransferase family 39 protein [Anaerolineae bacterium]MDW8102576.1 glycosyltransferase family 39 protein [Anaerolineae bacterium]
MMESIDRWGLILALIAFLALSLWNLSLPGLHYDEAKEAGLNAMEFFQGLPTTAFRGAQVRVGPAGIPLMVQDYIGALNVFLSLPFLGALGIKVEALRLYTVSAGAGTLFLTWAVARKLCGPPAGMVAALLLAFNPSFVFWNRQGIFVTSITSLFLMASLLCGLRWWDKRRLRDLYCLALLWGLGLYSKVLFLWAIVAMVLSATAGLFRRLPSIRQLILALIIFFLPLLPFLAFNAMTKGTISTVLRNLQFSYYGISNLSWGENVLTRLKQVVTLLKGDHLWYLGGIFSNPVAPWVGGGLALVTLILVLTRKAERKALLPVLIIGFIVAESAFTISGLFITHYFFLLPLLALAGAIGVALLFRASGFSRPVKVLATFAFLLWASGDLRATVLYHRALAFSGGHSFHSDAIYNLASYLLHREGSSMVALDWGIEASVRFLTLGKATPVEIFGYESFQEPDAGFRERASLFLKPGTIFIAHAPEDTVFRGRVEALEALAQERKLKLQEVAHFREKSGRLIYIILQVE